MTRPFLSAPDLSPGSPATIYWGATTLACEVVQVVAKGVHVRLAKSRAASYFPMAEVQS